MSLLLALGRCIWWPFLSVIPPRLLLTLFRYGQPVLIDRTIEYISEASEMTESSKNGNELVIAATIIYVGMAVSQIPSDLL